MDTQTKQKCLVCDRPAVSRGLCRSHYEIFRKSKQLSKDPAAYEAEAIRRKLVSAEDKRKAKNPFEDLRNELDSPQVAAESQENYTKAPKRKEKP